jgi:hypothetical protein
MTDKTKELIKYFEYFKDKTRKKKKVKESKPQAFGLTITGTNTKRRLRKKMGRRKRNGR